MSKSIKLLFSVLIAVLVVAAYLIANNTTPGPNPKLEESGGISLHALSENEAQIVNASGVRWIRIDVSPEIDMAVKNAKAYDLKVLGILDSWMFNKNSNFTLEEWSSNVTHYVSQYTDYVDAWEIWNKPANPEINNTLLIRSTQHIVEFDPSKPSKHEQNRRILFFNG